MKLIKRAAMAIGILLLVLFFGIGFEYDFGYKYPTSSECTFSGGQSRVYVHWFKPMNNTISVFCDNSTTPIEKQVIRIAAAANKFAKKSISFYLTV